MQSTPSGPTPQQQTRGNRRKRHPPPSASSSVRSFGTALWDQKLKKKNFKKTLVKELNREIQEEVLQSLQKIKEDLEADSWLYDLPGEFGGNDF